MSWSVDDCVQSAGFVAVRFWGVLERDDLALAFENTVQVCRDRDHFVVLADCSALQGGHTVLDLMVLLQSLNALGVADRFREAVVRPTDPQYAELADFWQDAAQSRGIDVRAFDSREAAEEWLTR